MAIINLLFFSFCIFALQATGGNLMAFPFVAYAVLFSSADCKK